MMAGWWLVRGLYYPTYWDYMNPRMGNPVLNQPVEWNDTGILWPLSQWDFWGQLTGRSGWPANGMGDGWGMDNFSSRDCKISWGQVILIINLVLNPEKSNVWTIDVYFLIVESTCLWFIFVWSLLDKFDSHLPLFLNPNFPMFIW